jgi:hypothetical protein
MLEDNRRASTDSFLTKISSECSVAEHWPHSCFMRWRDYLSNIRQAQKNRQTSDSLHRHHVLHLLDDLHVAAFVMRNIVATTASSATSNRRERFANERVRNARRDATVHCNCHEHHECFRHLECERNCRGEFQPRNNLRQRTLHRAVDSSATSRHHHPSC